PAEGIKLKGKVSFAELDIAEEDRFYFPEDVYYDLVLAPAGGNTVLVRGSVKANIAIICDRCNQEGHLSLAFSEVCHQYENAYGKVLDLTPDIREDILITFPQKFLCRFDCQGLCPLCGQDLNAGVCDCAGKSVAELLQEEDPWRGLDTLRLS
ncbi:MAG: DUF177 domain-containing protein, partial [Lentisphaeria bacterium]